MAKAMGFAPESWFEQGATRVPDGYSDDTTPMSAADSGIGLSSCLEALGGNKEHRDPPGVAHEKASTFALLGRDAGYPYPLAHGGDFLGVVEHHCPVAQPYPALRDGRYALSTPDVEAEVVMVAASRHERR